MQRIAAWVAQARAWFDGLGLGGFERQFIKALMIAAAFHLVVWMIERATRTRGDEYFTRDFGYDMAYWFFYRTGLNYFLIVALFFPPLDRPIAWLDLGLLADSHVLVQLVVFFVLSDLHMYWVHRALHRFPPLWAFHTTHHAPERMTFATSSRFHPVEILLSYIGFYFMVRLTGVNPLAWLPVLVFMEIMLQAQHTRIPWKLGPLYYVLVTPSFHRLHHSDDPAHFDRNFGAILSIWDHLFGTALPRDEPAPRRLGIEGVRHGSFASTLAAPFQLLWSQARRKSREPAPPPVS